MPLIDSRYSCKTLQVSLDQLVGQVNNPFIKNLENSMDYFGTINALSSQANRSSVEIIPIVPSSQYLPSLKNSKWLVRHPLIDCQTANTGIPDHCGGVTSDSVGETIVDVEFTMAETDYLYRSFEVDRNLYQEICENSTAVIAQKLSENALSILRSEESKHIDSLIIQLDNYASDGTSSVPGASTEKTLKFFNDKAVPNTMGLNAMLNQYRIAGYGGVTPFVIGGLSLASVFTANQAYLGNSVVNPMFIGGIIPMVDFNYVTIAAAQAGDSNDRVLSFLPGHHQIVSWYRYGAGSPLVRSEERGSKGLINLLGQTFDLVIEDNFGCDTIKYTIGRATKLWSYDKTLLKACTRKGATYNFIVDCGDLGCADVK